MLYGCNNTFIPNTVTSIGDGAFYRSKITNIVIPGTVTSIGYEAFYECKELTNVTLQEGIQSINNYTFYACEKLADISIPASVTNIGTGAFFQCIGLTSIEVNEGNTIYNSINDCNAIIETATNKLLFGCKNTVIPEGVVSIAYRAFLNYEDLTSISIPASVTSIDSCAFQGCGGIVSIVVSEDNTVYDSRNNCNAIIETATNKLLKGCVNTVMPSTVTSIGEYAFHKCGLTNVEIPDNITSIEGYAFDGCNNLTDIYIPASVTSMSNYTFLGCSALREIVVDAENTVYDSRGNCNAIIETATNKLILGCANTEIPNTVTSIDAWAFDYCENVGKLVIPDSVVSMGQNAFYYCSNILIEMASDIPGINENAFCYNTDI